MDNDRRDFLKKVGLTAAAAAAAPACAPASAGEQAQPADAVDATAAEAARAVPRAGLAGKFALELNGSFAGWLLSYEGGTATADVVTEKVGPDHISKKHIANVKYEDITIVCGTGMSKGFYEWIRSSLQRNYARKNGSIVAADYQLRERSRLDFTNALISEVGLPALDASSKDAAKMTIKFSPEVTRHKLGSGAELKFSDPRTQKRWLPSNFRLTISGLEDATSRANKIEAITIKQKIVENSIGEQRDYQKEPAELEFSNLVVTLAASQAQSFYDWHEDFVIRGNCSDDRELGGSLEYSDQQNRPMFSLTFHNIGVFKVAPDKLDVGVESVRRVKAEMYVERIDFDPSIGWA